MNIDFLLREFVCTAPICECSGDACECACRKLQPRNGVVFCRMCRARLSEVLHPDDPGPPGFAEGRAP